MSNLGTNHKRDLDLAESEEKIQKGSDNLNIDEIKINEPSELSEQYDAVRVTNKTGMEDRDQSRSLY